MRNLFRLLLLGIILSVAFSPASKAAQFFFMDNELNGKPAPDFTLKTTTGDNINLAKFRADKKTIVFFWATWCPHCRESLTDLNKRKDELAKKNIQLALVDIGENEKLVKKYLDKNNINFDAFLDEDETLAEPYGIIGVPTFVFINEKGIVREVLHALPRDFEKLFEG